MSCIALLYADKLSRTEIARRLHISKRKIKHWTNKYSIPCIEYYSQILYEEQGVKMIVQLYRELEKQKYPKSILWMKKKRRKRELHLLTKEYEKSLRWYENHLKNSNGMWDAINKGKMKPINIISYPVDKLFYEEF